MSKRIVVLGQTDNQKYTIKPIDNQKFNLSETIAVGLIPSTEQLNVIPNDDIQVFIPEIDHFYNKVTVQGVQTETANVKSSLAEQTIRPSADNKYINEIKVAPILLETAEIQPTTSEQVIRPSEGADGLSEAKIGAIQTEQPTIKTNGTHTPSAGKFFDKVVVEVEDIPAKLQEKSVTPTREPQTVLPDTNFEGMSKVEVGGIPAEFIVPSGSITATENKTYDVTKVKQVVVAVPEKADAKLITGYANKNGTYKASDYNADGFSEFVVEVAENTKEPILQNKEVTPTKETQVVTADEGYDGLNSTTVKPIPDEYIIPAGELEIKENDTYDVTDKKTVVVNVPIPEGYVKPEGELTITENNKQFDVTDKKTVFVSVPNSGGGGSGERDENETMYEMQTIDYMRALQNHISMADIPSEAEYLEQQEYVNSAIAVIMGEEFNG